MTVYLGRCSHHYFLIKIVFTQKHSEWQQHSCNSFLFLDYRWYSINRRKIIHICFIRDNWRRKNYHPRMRLIHTAHRQAPALNSMHTVPGKVTGRGKHHKDKAISRTRPSQDTFGSVLTTHKDTVQLKNKSWHSLTFQFFFL